MGSTTVSTSANGVGVIGQCAMLRPTLPRSFGYFRFRTGRSSSQLSILNSSDSFHLDPTLHEMSHRVAAESLWKAAGLPGSSLQKLKLTSSPDPAVNSSFRLGTAAQVC